MKINCYNYCLFWCLALQACLSKASDTLVLNTTSTNQNLKGFTTIYVSENKVSTFSLETLNQYNQAKDERSFFYLDFDVTAAYSAFSLKNASPTKKEIIFSFSYPFLEDVKIYKAIKGNLSLEGNIGIHTLKRSVERTWKIPIVLLPNEEASYFLVFNKSKGKPLATDITLRDSNTDSRISGFQNLGIGSYLGLVLLSLLFTIFIFVLVKRSLFLWYGLYLIALAIFMGSYLGYTNVFLPSQKLDLGRAIYVISIELSTAIFVLFAQQILMAKRYLPRLKKCVEIVIVFQVAFRIFLHFVANSLYAGQVKLFMKLWYATILFLVIAVTVEIFTYLRHNKKVGSYFAVSYLFMAVGSIALVLHHSFGLLKLSFYGLPGIFYASAIEIFLLTTTLTIVVGQIYRERNTLSEKLILQQQKFLNAFVQGQEDERKRVGSELHDNIGSKISNLKRLFSAKYSDAKMQKEFDDICEDVRDVAHSITPAEISLVGLSGAIDELLETIEKTEQLTINFNTFQFPENLNEGISTHLFRIVQELLQNVIKHANASSVDIQLFGHNNSVTLSFEDDGQGIVQKNSSSGIGLKNIKSRVAQMNGQFLFDSVKDKGTSVLVIIPTKYT
ncbi:7TM diverse intracellular signaling domain-containing protein [Flagellimonas sp. CMM7]|uniref:sensor histidine kinase n=1 Tax=Flagellimonas sp. CMM7 TaxID=2654676 RepID=UPI0013D5D529|nr:7TM diverse intracellular signaling domain-containing protein [Flagellimonas sp. CMM7]UII81626.1 ATP-binding protein [Flagellimonas sp. CMM7]